MSENCISCKRELNDINRYPSSWSCKSCHNKSRNKRRKRNPRPNRKTLQAVLATKTCCFCNLPDKLFLLLNKNIALYHLKELQDLDACHITCLIYFNTLNFLLVV